MIYPTRTARALSKETLRPDLQKTRVWVPKTDPEKMVLKTGDRGSENGPVYRLYQIATNGPQTVGEGPNEQSRSDQHSPGQGSAASFRSARLRVVIEITGGKSV